MRTLIALLFALSVACGAPTPGLYAEASSDAAAWEPQGDGFLKATAPMPEMRAALEVPETPDVPELARQVIHRAVLGLVVVSRSEAEAAVIQIARGMGGHLQQSDARTIVVRVPAARFEEALAAIGRLGELVRREVSAADVTEELFDLDIRIENARQARERLLAHLAASQELEHTLALERELTRVTEELERMEGRRRFLAAQVALSTITVHLDSNDPSVRPREGVVVPFPWLEQLGDGLVAGNVAARPRTPRFLARGPAFDTPESFLKYFQSEHLVEAMDADGVRIKVQRHDNFDKGALAFWQKLARRALVEGRGVALADERELGAGRALLRGTREVAGTRYGYLLVLVRTERRVLTFEAWGPEAQFDALRTALEASAQSLRP